MHKIKILLTAAAFGLILSGCKKDDSPITPDLQYTDIGGHTNATLSLSKSPYRVTTPLIVDSAAMLTIEAGVRIYFEDTTGIEVHGKLNCSGTATKQILFTSKGASWKGLQISGTTDQSKLQFVIIENVDVSTTYGSTRESAVEIVNADAVISNSIFRNNKSKNGGALYLTNSESLISNNIFINNFATTFGGALISSSSSNKILNNTFYKNVSYNFAGGLLLVSPVLDSVQNNIFFENTSVTGDPRIALLQADSNHFAAQYNFLQAGNDPYFISTTDLHLSTKSPCINAGNSASQYNDVDGTRNDQGAYGGALGNW